MITPENEVMPAEITHRAEHAGSRWQRTRQAALGLGCMAAAAAGVWAVTEGVVNADNSVAITTDHARPSDTLANAFDLLTEVGEGLGVLVAVKRGARHIDFAVRPTQKAIYDMAHTKRGVKGRLPRSIASVGLLAAGAGIMTGNYLNVADSISASQANVAQGVFDHVMDAAAPDTPGSVFYASSSSTPELLFPTHVSKDSVAKIIKSATADDVTAVPGREEWHSAFRSGEKDAKLELITFSLPHEVTGLPEADDSCTDVSAAASKELGVPIGGKINVEGLPVTIDRMLPEGTAGANMVPVVFNNEDFARCLASNPEQPFNFVLLKGTKARVEAALKDAGLSGEDAASRIFAVPEQEYISNSLQTGKNNVNSLVLEAMSVGLLFAGAALGGKARSEMVAARAKNGILKFNGFSNKMIARIYQEKAEAAAVQSSAIAMVGVLAVDGFTNSSIPGAALGPSLGTYAAVLGLTWGVNRLATSVSLRRELPKLEAKRGYVI